MGNTHCHGQDCLCLGCGLGWRYHQVHPTVGSWHFFFYCYCRVGAHQDNKKAHQRPPPPGTSSYPTGTDHTPFQGTCSTRARALSTIDRSAPMSSTFPIHALLAKVRVQGLSNSLLPRSSGLHRQLVSLTMDIYPGCGTRALGKE